MIGHVYIIRNTVNAKVYVGKTTRNPAKRFEEHCSEYSQCLAIGRAIKKYGKDSFSMGIVFETESREELNFPFFRGK